YYSAEAPFTSIEKQQIAVVGYGSQGHAHAKNLKESGLNVIVALPEGSKSRAVAQADGFEVMTAAEAAKRADVIMIAIPDTAQKKMYEAEIAPNIKPGALLLFAHGFNIHFKRITPAEGIDVGMVAPKGPGHLVRSVYVSGGGVPALFAVHQDATGTARARTMAYANGLGCTRAGIMETTFKDETESDLFGEQAVLCGGTAELVKSAWETLVEAGYDPQLAYFETMHELKLIVDLMYRGGLDFMRFSISDTAEYGDYVSGPRIIDASVKARMKEVLKEIQDGTFAKGWIAEDEAGRPNYKTLRAANSGHPIEKVGRELRRQMTFLNPVEVDIDGAQGAAEKGAAK
ncbi:MAG: ketol-acid reductoisomerase, partial [Candidatus Limnocylindrus sp.]